MTYRILLFITCAFISIFTAWLAGYDFDHRGVDVALTFIIVTFLCGIVSSYPESDLDKKVFK